jgi:hypothetical protein
MSYIVYRKNDTVIVSTNKTESAAKASATRLVKGGKYSADELRVSDSKTFHMFIEATVERVNMMTGEVYNERINTPNCCSPASETYWSM